MSEEKTTPSVNVFAVGNVLDPHIRIEGRCRACRGEGLAAGRLCPECGGTGVASALVRLSELLTVMGPAAELARDERNEA